MAMSRAARIENIRVAVESAPALFARALELERQLGETDPRCLAAWAALEVASGAPMHRQSRIVAGKPRGG